MGNILIYPDPLPDLSAEQSNQTHEFTDSQIMQTLPLVPLLPLNVSYVTATGSDDHTASSLPAARDIQFTCEFGGTKLPCSAIFMTLYASLIHIASALAGQAAQQPFTARYEMAGTEMVIKAYDESRAPLPTFRYKDIAQLFESLARYMIDKIRFEDFTFVWKIAGVPVGRGELRKYSGIAAVGFEKG